MKHQTVGKDLKRVIEKIRNHSSVKKVVIGRYENCRHHYSPGSVKIQSDIENGFKMFGYDGSGQQEFYVYVDSLEKRSPLKNWIQSL